MLKEFTCYGFQVAIVFRTLVDGKNLSLAASALIWSIIAQALQCVCFTLNGKPHLVENPDPDMLLVDFIRYIKV